MHHFARGHGHIQDIQRNSSVFLSDDRRLLRWQGRSECLREAEDHNEGKRVNEKLHAGGLVGVADERMQHAAEETSTGQNRGCIQDGIFQSGCNARLLKENDALSGKSSREKSDKKGCNAEEITARNLDQAKKRQGGDSATKQQTDKAARYEAQG
jgi:hypothetical protein